MATCLCRALVGFLTIAVLPQATSAKKSPQPNPIQDAAGQIAKALAREKIRSVVVFDFAGPGDGITVLGRTLADNLSASLVLTGGALNVRDRSLIAGDVQRERISVQLPTDPDFASLLAADLKAKGFIIGRLDVKNGGGLSLLLSCYSLGEARPLKNLRITWPPSEAIRKALAANPLLPDSTSDLASYPESGKLGYSLPRCLECPHAAYTEEAKRQRAEGTVKLIAVIGTDGRVHDIHIVKALPYGLTTASIRAVQQWKLAPATAPDGKPAAVWEIIEVTFRLF